VEKPKLFISHISEEAELAEALKSHLVDDFLNMVDVFVSSDETSIGPGGNWLEAVDSALKSSQVHIILCSEESIRRPWINFEAGAAWLRGIPIVPVCHSGLRVVDLPIPLSLLKAVQANQEAGLNTLYRLIAAKLGSSLPKVNLDSLVDEITRFEDKRQAQRQAAKAPKAAASAVAGALPGPTQQVALPQPQKSIHTLDASNDPAEVAQALSYLKANPTVDALSALATVADRDDFRFASLRDDAIDAMGRIRNPAALELLLARAVSEQTPGYKARYVRALQSFAGPSMIAPLITVLEDAGGDVVGYPALELARKLNDPRLIAAVYHHFEFSLKSHGATSYLEFCRETLFQLETVALHRAQGVELDLPTSLYKLLARLSPKVIEAESTPTRRALYLRHLFSSHALPPEVLGQVCLANLASTHVLVRWCAVELATLVPAKMVGDFLREALVREQMPLLVGLMAKVASLDWRPTDCTLLIDKLREYCITDRSELGRCVETIQTLARLLVRNSCKEGLRALNLIAEAIETDEYQTTAAEGIRRAIRLLEAS
jgi:hypothetical protein